jgi:hypothetical protein
LLELAQSGSTSKNPHNNVISIAPMDTTTNDELGAASMPHTDTSPDI